MGKVTAVIFAGLLATAVVVGVVAAARNVKTSTVTHREKPLLKRVQEIKSENPGGRPQADPVKTEFNFGTLNPATTASHTFVIRNTGTVPLVLRQGPTSCKCTVSSLTKNTVFPGKESDLTLEWNTGRSEAEFRQSAKLYTNDPDRHEIDFEVYGKVRLACCAEPAALLFPDILPGSTSTTQTLICSQKWHSFSISHIESNIAGLSWKVEPLTASELQAIDARSGHRIEATSPPDFSAKSLSGTLSVTAIDDQTQEQESLELAVGGKLRQRVAVFGSQIDEKGVVDFGLLAPGQGAKASLVLRVRDDEPQPPSKISVVPDFVESKVTPMVDSAGVAKPGLYKLELEIPSDAPPGRYQGFQQGQVTLNFDHPRIEPLTIKLSFAIKSSLLD